MSTARQGSAFTTVAIMTLAVAIGANTAIFSVADAVLFKPLPYTDPDRVYVLDRIKLLILCNWNDAATP